MKPFLIVFIVMTGISVVARIIEAILGRYETPKKLAPACFDFILNLGMIFWAGYLLAQG